MTRVTVSVNVNVGWLQQQMAGGDLDKAFMRAGGVVRDRARRNIDALGRVRSGRMKQNIVVEKVGGVYQVRAATPYSGFQEAGTKAHGPRRARLLAFKPNGSGDVVFAKRVRGVSAGNFMRDAGNSLTSADLLK